MRLRGYDAWVTREPPYNDEPRPPLKCSTCGQFLAREPLGRREWMSVTLCTGEPHVITCTYDADRDAGILAIIGDEYAGTTYEVAYPPACGDAEPQHIAQHDGDIDPKKAAIYWHAPHFYEDEPMSPCAAEIRVCFNGHYNEEPIW